jgi:hypothetical protein
MNDDPTNPDPNVRLDLGAWLSGPCLPVCGRCGQPKPDDGNDWCTSCENENAADVLAALRGTGSSGAEVQTIAEFLHRYGDRWQLEEHPAFRVWLAVHRPTPTSEHVIVAERITELAAKVAAAEAARDLSGHADA